ncbi:hypothetical protein GCM10023215_31540 [Pseudonocardia yuanmonensis]|uniref:Uncharacterized protein n=1 Tax=Pseudonocardia yuanmonensis TaxID=1095914 RepID=A0ABP8WQ04_9PSEU
MRLAGLVAFHSAAAAEAKCLGLGDELASFEDERSLVRDLLWFADMTVGQPRRYELRSPRGNRT